VPETAIEIRAFAPPDLAGVIDLMLQLQKFERQLVPDHAAPDQSFGEWYVARLLREIEEHEGALLVATRDGALCGFCAGFVDEDAEARSHYFYIAELSVAEKMRGQGIGTRLIQAMEDVARARGHHTAVIGVLAASRRVHALYNRLGYRDRAVRLRKKL
jgi:ribosomal protein S18 acetylase RimI-like enzyme